MTTTCGFEPGSLWWEATALTIAPSLASKIQNEKIKGWLYLGKNMFPSRDTHTARPQKSPYFCVLKYAWAVKQTVWSEAENGERDWGAGRLYPPFWGVCCSRASRFALPISLPILRKQTDCFVVYDTVLCGSLKKLFKGAVSWLASLFSFVKSQLCVLSFFDMEFEKLLTNDKTQQRVMLTIVLLCLLSISKVTDDKSELWKTVLAKNVSKTTIPFLFAALFIPSFNL